jgi:hypothetical protein
MLKLLQENLGKSLEVIGVDMHFLNMILIVQKIRARIQKWIVFS